MADTSLSRSAAGVFECSAALACWATGLEVTSETSSDWMRATVAESWAWVWLGSIRAGRLDGRTSRVEVAVYCLTECNPAPSATAKPTAAVIATNHQRSRTTRMALISGEDSVGRPIGSLGGFKAHHRPTVSAARTASVSMPWQRCDVAKAARDGGRAA